MSLNSETPAPDPAQVPPLNPQQPPQPAPNPYPSPHPGQSGAYSPRSAPADNSAQSPAVECSNDMATAGLVFAFLIPLLGLIFSLIGLQRAKQYNGKGQGLAIAGLVISLLGMLVGVMIVISLFNASTELVTPTIGKPIKQISSDSSDSSSTSKPSVAPQSFNADTKPQAMKILTGTPDITTWSDEYYYRPARTATCQYYLTNNPTSRSDINAIDGYYEYWVDYTSPITVTALNSHILAKNCGTWTKVNSP